MDVQWRRYFAVRILRWVQVWWILMHKFTTWTSSNTSGSSVVSVWRKFLTWHWQQSKTQDSQWTRCSFWWCLLRQFCISLHFNIINRCIKKRLLGMQLFRIGSFACWSAGKIALDVYFVILFIIFYHIWSYFLSLKFHRARGKCDCT